MYFKIRLIYYIIHYAIAGHHTLYSCLPIILHILVIVYSRVCNNFWLTHLTPYPDDELFVERDCLLSRFKYMPGPNHICRDTMNACWVNV